MILVINSKGLTFHISSKNIDVKTPAKLKISQQNLSLILSELSRQGIKEWYLIPDERVELKSIPYKATNRSSRGASKLQATLTPVNVTMPEIDFSPISNKLDMIIDLLEKLVDRSQIVRQQSISKEKSLNHKINKLSQQPEFIPEIDISSMDIKSSSENITYEEVDLDSLNDTVNTLGDLFRGDKND